ncbi:MAG: winged helix-turn-helix domain-containing protein [Candidatus Binatia bacterium]
MTATLSATEARRLAVASQAFGRRPAKPTLSQLRKLAARLNAFQIDSVNVFARAHYVPAYARLGPYPMRTLDSLAYRKRELFEFWGHAACLLPMSLYPVVRYRMDHHLEPTLDYMRTKDGAYMASVYGEVAERGPITAAELSNPGKRRGNWWGWAPGKANIEHLYNAGLVAIAGRRGFERLYDITERVIPKEVLETPALGREEAMKELICLGARACGVGTFHDITRYLNVDGWRDRLPAGPYWARPKGRGAGRAKPVAKRLVAELVGEGRLVPALVDGWKDKAYMHPRSRVPGAAEAESRALVTPFDSLVWERDRVRRVFGMDYTLEMYVPAHKRVHGYYVLPFLLGDELVARCDLKADRERRTLVVQSAFVEPRRNAGLVASELAAELRDAQRWLELDAIEVSGKGDLAPKLRRATGRARSGRPARRSSPSPPRPA